MIGEVASSIYTKNAMRNKLSKHVMTKKPKTKTTKPKTKKPKTKSIWKKIFG